MKTYGKETAILLLQLFMFYIFPLFAGPTDAMGMVILILLATLLLSLLLGCISDKRIKYLYPPMIAIAFIPSVFLYYNASALVHALWYAVVSTVFLLMGTGIRKLAAAVRRK